MRVVLAPVLYPSKPISDENPIDFRCADDDAFPSQLVLAREKKIGYFWVEHTQGEIRNNSRSTTSTEST